MPTITENAEQNYREFTDLELARNSAKLYVEQFYEDSFDDRLVHVKIGAPTKSITCPMRLQYWFIEYLCIIKREMLQDEQYFINMGLQYYMEKYSIQAVKDFMICQDFDPQALISIFKLYDYNPKKLPSFKDALEDLGLDPGIFEGIFE